MIRMAELLKNRGMLPEAEMHYRLRGTYGGIFRQARFYAQSFVLLCKIYHPYGLPPPASSYRTLFLQWCQLVRNVPMGRNRPKETGEWLWQFGWRLGCLQVSVKHRYFVP
jgi:hypothetical protein